MSKRRFVNILTALMVMVMLMGCSENNAGNSTSDAAKGEAVHYSVDAKTDSYASLDEVENAADIIIRGVRLENEETVIKKSDEYVLSSYTFSEVEVTDVYKNSTSQIAKGDVITILENEAYDEETQIVYHVAGYNMMVEGNEYILFLEENELDGETYYVSVGVNYGTVSLEDDGRMVQVSAQTDTSSVDYSEYNDIWEAAKEKYK